MQIPPQLSAAINEAIHGQSITALRRDFNDLSAAYARGRGPSPFVDSEDKVLAYIATRMPSMYVVLRSIFEELADRYPDTPPHSLIDVGAGPGTVLWAASQVWETLTSIRQFDNSTFFRAMGKQLLTTARHPLEQTVTWEELDLQHDSPSFSGSADLVTASYVLGELSTSAQQNAIRSLWEIADRWIVLVEPGTPDGFRRLLSARDILLRQGAHLVAPCAGSLDCPLSSDRWCHFARRVERTRAQRSGKSATLGFEDEKYSFLVCSKTPAPPFRGRIVSPPTVLKHEVSVELCDADNHLTTITARKRESPETFRELAKKYRWGDFFLEK